MAHITSKSAKKKRDYIELLRFCRGVKSGSAYTRDETVELRKALATIGDVSNPVRQLLPILYRNLKTSGLFDKLDIDIQHLIKNSAMVLIAREAASQRWLQQTIESFKGSNIPIILLKGAAFSGYLYSEEAPRPGVDVDILVKGKDFDKACSVLQQTMEPLIIDKDRPATHESLFERVFVPNSPSKPTVELHRGLTNPYIFNIDEDALWLASEPHCKYYDESVRVLSPNHTLLHLAVHGFRDLEFCSHGLLDVDKMVSLRGINGETLYSEAELWGAKGVLYHLLANSQQIMGTRIPKNLLDRLEPGQLAKQLQLSVLERTSIKPENTSALRMTQLWSQLIFPDKLSAALRFQTDYILTRLKDLFSR